MSAVGQHDPKRIDDASTAAAVGIADALGGPCQDLGDWREAAHAMVVGYADALAACIFLGIDEDDVLAVRAVSEERCKATLSKLHRNSTAGSA